MPEMNSFSPHFAAVPRRTSFSPQSEMTSFSQGKQWNWHRLYFQVTYFSKVRIGAWRTGTELIFMVRFVVCWPGTNGQSYNNHLVYLALVGTLHLSCCWKHDCKAPHSDISFLSPAEFKISSSFLKIPGPMSKCLGGDIKTLCKIVADEECSRKHW